jgi:hypothetical protein
MPSKERVRVVKDVKDKWLDACVPKETTVTSLTSKQAKN